MVRDFHLADFFTLCNAACGVAGVFLAMLFAVDGDKRAPAFVPDKSGKQRQPQLGY